MLDVASFRELGNAVNETVYKLMLCAGNVYVSCHLQIDWEESTNAARVCVRPHIDEELDNLKHIYHGIDAVLVRMVCISLEFILV